jgi:hypothetical protein
LYAVSFAPTPVEHSDPFDSPRSAAWGVHVFHRVSLLSADDQKRFQEAWDEGRVKDVDDIRERARQATSLRLHNIARGISDTTHLVAVPESTDAAGGSLLVKFRELDDVNDVRPLATDEDKAKLFVSCVAHAEGFAAAPIVLAVEPAIDDGVLLPATDYYAVERPRQLGNERDEVVVTVCHLSPQRYGSASPSVLIRYATSIQNCIHFLRKEVWDIPKRFMVLASMHVTAKTADLGGVFHSRETPDTARWCEVVRKALDKEQHSIGLSVGARWPHPITPVDGCGPALVLFCFTRRLHNACLPTFKKCVNRMQLVINEDCPPHVVTVTFPDAIIA